MKELFFGALLFIYLYFGWLFRDRSRSPWEGRYEGSRPANGIIRFLSYPAGEKLRQVSPVGAEGKHKVHDLLLSLILDIALYLTLTFFH